MNNKKLFFFSFFLLISSQYVISMYGMEEQRTLTKQNTTLYFCPKKEEYKDKTTLLSCANCDKINILDSNTIKKPLRIEYNDCNMITRITIGQDRSVLEIEIDERLLETIHEAQKKEPHLNLLLLRNSLNQYILLENIQTEQEKTSKNKQEETIKTTNVSFNRPAAIAVLCVFVAGLLYYSPTIISYFNNLLRRS